ncbi:MAG: YraN family protein [Pyrinomonadaceae bacterium]|nr:YraN family protein [Pyrinomonadaceae bacterium]
MPNSSPAPSANTSTILELGRRGEELAAAFLMQAGFQIVAANFTIPVGRNRNDAVVNVEIDLVTYEGPTLCFVEVKTRASDWFAAPSANVDLRKQRQIIRAAHAYRRMFDLTKTPYRYDVVSIVLPTAEEGPRGLRIELLRNFWSEEKFRKRRWPERYCD